MKKSLILLLISFINLQSISQDWLNNVLKEIELNNQDIKSYSLWKDAKIANSKVGITPNNPFIEAGWFPAEERGAGMKQTWGITQSFDFPTVYFQKIKKAKTSKTIAETEYLMYRQEVLLDAKLMIIEHLFAKKIKDQLEERLNQTQKISDFFQKRVVTGNASLLELHNAQSRLVDIKDRLTKVNSELEQINLQLLRIGNRVKINIGDSINVNPVLFNIDSLINFYKQLDPRFRLLVLNQTEAHEELQLAKNEWLPEFEVGYESEKTDAETFRGVKVGLALPLWKNSGKIKYAKLAESAISSEMQAYESTLITELSQNYSNAKHLFSRLNDYNNFMHTNNSIILLSKALENGHISAIDYFNEVEYIYNLEVQKLEVEKEYLISISKLNRYEL